MKNWVNRLVKKTTAPIEGVLGISLTPHNASWCLLESEDNHLKMESFGLLDQPFETPAAGMKALLDQTPIPRQSCIITLGHQFYEMLLVDEPEVPELEMREAVKWKLKDLVSKNVQSYVVDAFKLPSDAYRGRMKMVYAAAIESQLISQLVDVCHQAELPILGIGVNELSMTTLAKSFANSHTDESIAVVCLNGHGGTINLIENGHLYLTRTIEIEQENQATFSGNLGFQANPAENLSVDIQRSLDYYESQLGKSNVAKVYLLASDQNHSEWWRTLREKLSTEAELYVFPEHLQEDQSYGALTAGVVAPAIGVALGALHEPS